MQKIHSLFFSIIFFSLACKTRNQTIFRPIPVDFIKIIGETKKIDGAVVSIVNPDFKKNIWIDTIRNGKFTVFVHLPVSGFYNITFKGKYPADSTAQGWIHGFKLYLENNHSYRIVTGTDRNILYNHHIVYSNSDTQNKLFEFYKTYWDLYHYDQNKQYEKSVLEKQIASGNNDAVHRKLLTKATEDVASAQTLMANLPLTFALKNPNSIVSTHILLEVNENDLKIRLTDYKYAFDNLLSEVKIQKDGLLFKERLQKLQKLPN